MNSNVAIEYRKDITDYPSGKYYYNPSNKYPEYPFGDEIAGEENPVYDMVRNTLYSMGYDRDNFGKKEWNPLGDIIKKNQKILVKPNWVMHINKAIDDENDLRALVTHPSVVRAIVDYVYIALTNSGEIYVADAPMQECNLEEALKKAGYEHAPRAKRDVVEKGIPIDTFNGKDSEGRRMAVYKFGNWEEAKKQNSIAKTKGRNNLSDKLKQKLIKENGSKCALYGEKFDESLLQAGPDGWNGVRMAREIDSSYLTNLFYTDHYANDTKEKLSEKFAEAYYGKYGEWPDSYAALGYDSLMMTAEAIKRSKSGDPRSVAVELGKTIDFEGVTGKISLDTNHDAIKNVFVLTFQKGKPVLLEKRPTGEL